VCHVEFQSRHDCSFRSRCFTRCGSLGLGRSDTTAITASAV
jgi:hypothetical protein